MSNGKREKLEKAKEFAKEAQNGLKDLIAKDDTPQTARIVKPTSKVVTELKVANAVPVGRNHETLFRGGYKITLTGLVFHIESIPRKGTQDKVYTANTSLMNAIYWRH